MKGFAQTIKTFKLAGIVLLLLIAVGTMATAQSLNPIPWPQPAAVPPPPAVIPAFQTIPAGIHPTGQIQYASLDPTPGLCNKDDNPSPTPANPPLPDQCKTTGGWIEINNELIRVPANVVVVFPNTLLTWEEMFELNPNTHQTDAVFESGLAMADTVRFPGTYEAHIDGQIVNGQYIAGLIFISQDPANFIQGFVEKIDYPNGIVYVNGNRIQINDPKIVITIPNPDGTPALDPVTGAPMVVTKGRYTAGQSPDPRFAVDQGNPTVHSQIGYPMCIPVTAPGTYNNELGIAGTPDPYVLALPPNAPPGAIFTGMDDPQCPEINRPRDTTTGQIMPFFNMNVPGAAPTPDNPFPQDPYLESPFEVGDWVEVIGTMEVDATGPYMTATDIDASVGTFTFPGVDPAYLTIEVVIQGTGGVDPFLFPQEAGVRTRVEGFTTDPQRTVDVSAIDQDCNGNVTFREPAWAANFPVEPGPPGIGVKGRWRMRFPQGGDFLPATQNVGARVSGAAVGKNKNGLDFSEYQLPTSEFIFPENQVSGNPPPPANYQDIQFLDNGLGPLPMMSGVFDSTAFQLGLTPNPFFPNQQLGQLSPFPSDKLPPLTCVPGTFVSVARPKFSSNPNPPFAGTTVTLDATASTPPTGPFTWTQIINPGDPVIPGLPANGPTFTFIAPLVGSAQNLTFSLVAGDGTTIPASVPATLLVPVIPPPPGTPPVVSVAVSPASPVASNSLVTLTASGVDPAGGTLTFTFTPDAAAIAAGIVLSPVTVNPDGTAFVTFTAPTVPVLTAAQTFTFTVTGTSSVAPGLAGTTTASVTVNPETDVITISNIVYRRTKGRLVVNVSDFTPNVTLTCTLDIINPATGEQWSGMMGPIIPFAQGIFSIRFSNIPPPNLVTITSSAGGVATGGVTFLR